LGCQPEWETGEGDCSTAAGGGGCQSRQAGGGEARGAALGRHDDVVNSIRGQRGGVAHRGGCSTVVGGWPEGISVEGWPAVAGSRVLGWEGVWRPGGAQGGADEAGGGPVRAGVTEALGGGGAAPVAPFDASATTTMELAWGWKVEEAPVAQLLGRSRCSGTARSTAADLARAESRGTRRARREENVKGKPLAWSSHQL
jgi:hypothetical protein